MVAEVLYRKWRPQLLAQVVGQEHVTRTLLNALAQGRVAHAYLFCGPRGTGKTSTARILAKAVNCLKSGRGEPCNACLMCKAVAEGSALDLIEIDAASNRGIDEVRELRERATYLPSEARFKVYIIDEVHMMTPPAFNALLKTLEEPPAHVIFVLATTEVQKLPLTIVSRCQRFDFRRLSPKDVEERLKVICQGEDVEVDGWALRFIARSGGGSLRDSENLLDQLMVSYGNHLGPDHVRELLGISADMPLKGVVVSIFRRDLAEGLRTLHRAAGQGTNLRHFHRELLEHLRALMAVKAAAEDVLDLPAEEIKELRELASTVTLEDVTRVLQIFAKADPKGDVVGALALETALVEACLALKGERDGLSMARPMEVKAAPKIAAPKIPSISEETRIPSVQIRSETSAKSEAGPGQQEPRPVVTAGSLSSADAGNNHFQPDPAPAKDISVFRQRWAELVDALRGMGSKGSLDALMRNACEPLALEGETLVVGFYYPFHKSKIEDPKYRHLVEKKVNEVFGGAYKIRCDLVSRERSASTPKAQAHGPLVRAALEMGARIVEETPQGSD